MREREELSQEEFERLEAYLDGSMEQEARVEFQKLLELEPQLQNTLSELEATRNAVLAGNLQKQLDGVHQKHQAANSIAEQGNGKLWLRAAAVLALVGLGLFFLLKPDKNEQLFAEYFTPASGLPTQMGTTDNYTFQDGMVDYRSEQYNEALAKWMPLLASAPNNDTLNYYMGVGHLANKSHSKATPYLQTVTQLENSKFQQDAAWYLALAYLELGEVETAKMKLRSLIAPTVEQKALLEQLNNL